MAQIQFSRNPTGRMSFGLFATAVGAFVFSAADPLFGILALACIAAGAGVAALLIRRRPRTPHIAPWTVEGP